MEKTTEAYVTGECGGVRVKVLNVFFGDTYIEWPNGKREWVGRERNVKWPIEGVR